MDHLGGSKGYTVVEMMIVLTVSMVLFVATATAISQQNRRTYFTQSVQEFDRVIRDVLNDVENGFFPANADFNCNGTGASVSITRPGSTEQGTNATCIFVGKAMEFNGRDYTIHSLAGKRKLVDKEVTNIGDSRAVSVDSLKLSGALSADVLVTRVVALNTGSNNHKGFAVLTSFGQYSGTTLKSGLGDRTELAVFGPASLPPETLWSGLTEAGNVAPARDGILVCLQETLAGPGGGNRATVTIGGTSTSGTAVQIYSKGNKDSRCP